MSAKKKEKDPGFLVTRHHGVKFTFANGWGLSVQWGPGNYGSNYNLIRDVASSWDLPRKSEFWGADQAEVAPISPSGNLVPLPGEEDTVVGYCTPADVLEYMNHAAGLPAEMKEEK